MYSKDPNFLRAERAYLTPPDTEEFGEEEFDMAKEQILRERINDTHGWFAEAFFESVDEPDMQMVQRLSCEALLQESVEEHYKLCAEIGGRIVSVIYGYLAPSEEEVIERLMETYE